MVADNVCAVREIDYTKKLPDAEYEVMQAIWTGEPPLNTAYLMEQVGRERGWKAPTLISFLVRLEDRGYITSVKRGKERYYTPVADRDTYLRAVSEQFCRCVVISVRRAIPASISVRIRKRNCTSF